MEQNGISIPPPFCIPAERKYELMTLPRAFLPIVKMWRNVGRWLGAFREGRVLGCSLKRPRLAALAGRDGAELWELSVWGLHE